LKHKSIVKYLLATYHLIYNLISLPSYIKGDHSIIYIDTFGCSPNTVKYCALMCSNSVVELSKLCKFVRIVNRYLFLLDLRRTETITRKFDVSRVQTAFIILQLIKLYS
jgi:hypothetical protein